MYSIFTIEKAWNRCACDNDLVAQCVSTCKSAHKNFLNCCNFLTRIRRFLRMESEVAVCASPRFMTAPLPEKNELLALADMCIHDIQRAANPGEVKKTGRAWQGNPRRGLSNGGWAGEAEKKSGRSTAATFAERCPLVQ